MAIKELFNNYNKKVKYDVTESEKRHLKNLKSIINDLSEKKDLQEEIDDLEETITTITSNKYGCVNSYYKFLKYLKDNGYKNLKSNLAKNYETVTRRLELIKFLQTPKTREQILDEFLINSRTLDGDFSSLEKGIEFCGTKLEIKLSQYERQGRRTVDNEKYSSSCNPIGLPLNMTELYLLTNVVPNQIENEDVKRLYNNVIRKIYPQLSKHALALMNIEDCFASNKFEFEYEQLVNDAFNQLMYFMKRESDKECIIIYQKNGERKEIKGFVCQGSDNSCFAIKNASGKTEIKYIDFIGIDENCFKKNYE